MTDTTPRGSTTDTASTAVVRSAPTSVARAATPEDVLLPEPRLAYLPIGLFGSVMSLCGLAIAWRLAQVAFDAPGWIATLFGVVALAAFVAVATGYATKAIAAPAAVVAEFRHPIAGNLFGTLFISLLLLPIVLVPIARPLAQATWIVGAIGMGVFAWVIVSRWLSDRQQLAHATPTWIVPVVGLLDVPLALPSLGLPPMPGVAIAALAIGLFFAIPLFTMILMRLVFEPPMPQALLPTLLILAAPFAVGGSAYVAATGQPDLFARALFAIDLFVLAVLVGRLRELARCCTFKVAWWAVGFPLAASAVAGLRIAAAVPDVADAAIAGALLGSATVVIVGLLVRTLVGVARSELRAIST